ncbi:MAG: CoA-binding protein [Nitrospinota bacterium]
MNDSSFKDPETIRAMLRDFRRIAVVGLSPKEHRPSHYVSAYMKKAGYEIVPVNPGHESLLGETCYPRLAALPEPPEVVNVFRRSDRVGGVVDEALAAGARAVWLQKGVIDEAAARRAREVGLAVVMDL